MSNARLLREEIMYKRQEGIGVNKRTRGRMHEIVQEAMGEREARTRARAQDRLRILQLNFLMLFLAPPLLTALPLSLANLKQLSTS